MPPSQGTSLANIQVVGQKLFNSFTYTYVVNTTKNNCFLG